MGKYSVTKELALLRSFAISVVGRDREGTYRPAFVEKILRSTHLRPTRRFKDADAFLEELES